jgi:hypothetical protein
MHQQHHDMQPPLLLLLRRGRLQRFASGQYVGTNPGDQQLATDILEEIGTNKVEGHVEEIDFVQGTSNPQAWKPE